MFRRHRFRSEPAAQTTANDDFVPEPASEMPTGETPGLLTDGPASPPLSLRRPTLDQLNTGLSSSTIQSARRESRGSISSGSQLPLGLHIVHQPEHSLGDLVFVHGLGGSAWKTWAWNRDDALFWPSWLPDQDERLANFRISTFGYNSKFKGSATNLDIIDFSKDLLFQLMTVLGAASDDFHRPLIFIAHSMGGLVVKKAYTLGKHDKQFSALISRVLGMVFLATPHRGSHYAKTLNNILSAAPLGTSAKAYVAGLSGHSSAIQDINESFRQHCDGVLLCSFYESLKTSIGLTKVLIVEKESAILGYPNEISAAMNADHHSICRFVDSDDSNFLKITGVLKRWTASLTLDVPVPEDIEDIDPLSPRSLNELIHDILDVDMVSDGFLMGDRDSTLAGSGSWLFNRSEFQTWCEPSEKQASNQFYLIGIPGTGKSVISRSTVAHLLGKEHSVQYFFFDQTNRFKRTAAYCIRQLAAQVATSCREFREALLNLYDKADAFFSTQKQNFQSLWERLFEGILFQLHLQEPLFWVLDGVDESDASALLLSRLAGLRSNTSINVFISSRPLKAIPVSEHPRIVSCILKPSDTTDDMKSYVSRMVQHVLPGDTHLQTFVQDEILRKAGGSFLWAKLALEVMQDSWHTQDDITSALTEVPEGMTAMYTRMAKAIDQQGPRNRQLAKQVISWVAFSWRPLLLDELADALKPDFGVFTNLALSLTQICGHFITLDHSESGDVAASLIHITAKEFLVHYRDEEALWIDSKQAHEKIAKVLLNYLCDDHWKKYFSSSEIAVRQGMNAKPGHGISRLAAAAKKYPLLKYATFHWAYHLSKSPIQGSELMEIVENFMLTYCLSWIEGIALSGDMVHLIRSAQYLRTYIKKSNRSSHGEAQWLQLWATDFIRIAGKFSGNLVLSPSSVYRNIPPLCPDASMISKTFGTPRPGALSVSGFPSATWDDCLASIITSQDEFATQIFVNETNFFILASSSGKVIMCRVSTCEHIKVLNHEEYVSVMTLNKTKSILATSGFTNFYIWSASSGHLKHKIPKTSNAMVRDIGICPADGKLLVALDNCTVQYIDLQPDPAIKTVAANLSSFEIRYQGCPWRQSISPDGTKVALAWRGSPPLVWDLRNPDVAPMKCRAVGPANSLLYSQGFSWRPETDSLLILCNNTSLFEWYLMENEIVEYPHVKARDMAISEDGSLLLTADSHNVSIWAFPKLNLIYSIATNGESITDMAFSVDNQRFYDIRNSTCNVWEPDALIRSEDHDHEETSSTTGSTAVTEPVISDPSSQYAAIRSLAAGPDDQSFVCGREDGTVIIYNAVDGRRERKVYTHPSSRPVVMLTWSRTGKYIASCDDGALLIVKKVQRKEDGKWAVFPSIEFRLEGPMRQLLFSADEKFLLIATAENDRVWGLVKKQQLYISPNSHKARRWILHPTKSDQIVKLKNRETTLYQWSTGKQIGDNNEASKEQDSPKTAQVRQIDSLSISQSPILLSASEKTVTWSCPADGGVYQVLASCEEQLAYSTRSHVNMQLEVLPVDSKQQRDACCTTIPLQVSARVKFLLGVMGHNLIFLGLDGWVLSYDLSPHINGFRSSSNPGASFTIDSDTYGLRRHYYLPKDWLNTFASHMTCINSKGTLLCPKNGDVAIVRNGLRL